MDAEPDEQPDGRRSGAAFDPDFDVDAGIESRRPSTETLPLLLPPARRRRRIPRLRVNWRQVGGRMRESWLPIVQIIVAALASYSVAHFALGHAIPVLAVTVAISSLGFQRDARPLRVAETAAGMVLGIAISEVIFLTSGSGVWQLALALAVVLLVGRIVSRSPAFAVAAAVQVAFVIVLPPPADGQFARIEDALLGGVSALLFTAILPRNPQRSAANASRRVFVTFGDALSSLAAALELGDIRPARHALASMRSTQPQLDAWAVSLDSALAVSRISPLLHRHLARLQEQSRLLGNVDLACRNLRVVARRVTYLIEEDDRPRPELAELLSRMRAGVDVLGRAAETGAEQAPARRFFEELAEWLAPELLGPEPSIADLGIILTLRPLLVDLLAASGLDPDEARALLPHLD